MKIQPKHNKNKGFGLIEILVSVAIFSVVAIMGITALLTLIDTGEKSQSLNAVMQNLNIALETMARDIRTGSHYACVDTANANAGASCSTTNGNTVLQYIEAGADTADRTVYTLQNNQIYLKRGGVESPITATEVKVDDLRFYVINANSTTAQPRVIMSLAGHVETREKNRVSFTLQTTMTQRVIEVDSEEETEI